MRRRISRITALLITVAAATLALVTSTAPAGAAPTWAPEASATLTPGVMAYTAGAQCTSNFVYTDSNGGVYLGYAAHCAGTGSSTDTDGCQTASLPLGTPVTFNKGGSLIDEGTQLGTGTLAYSSWLAMHAAGETDANTCAYNDLALVKISAADVAKVNPTVPFFGGPNALGTGTAAGDKIYSYGNSSLRAGVSQLSPKIGASLGDDAGGWTTSLYTVTPGIPGDSGSGFLDKSGNAFGVLSTVAIAPLPASNGVGNLRKELAYAAAHSGIPGLALATGTRAFAPPV
jgi:hypothetical protein